MIPTFACYPLRNVLLSVNSFLGPHNMYDLDDLDVEVLDDELFSTPAKESGPFGAATPDDATGLDPRLRPGKANPLSSLPPLRKPGGFAPLPPIARNSAPLGAPRAARDEAVSVGSDTPTRTANQTRTESADTAEARPGKEESRVIGSMMDGDDVSDSSTSDDDSDDSTRGETETETTHVESFHSHATQSKGRNADDKPPTNIPGLDACEGDDFEIAVADDVTLPEFVEKNKTSVPLKQSSGDAAIDAIDSLDGTSSRVTTKAQQGIGKLTEKYVDNFELGIDEKNTVGETSRSPNAAADDEFGYAFDGGVRDGPVTREPRSVTSSTATSGSTSGSTSGGKATTTAPIKQLRVPAFKPQAMPSALVTNVRSMPLETFEEGEEEEEEEKEEEEEDTQEEDIQEEEDDIQTPSEEVDEWDVVTAAHENGVEAMDAGRILTGDGPDPAPKHAKKPVRKPPQLPLTYDSVRGYFACDGLDDAVRKTLNVCEDQTPVGCCGALFNPQPKPLSDSSQQHERDVFFATAKLPMDDADATHVNLLNAVYASCTSLLESSGSNTDDDDLSTPTTAANSSRSHGSDADDGGAFTRNSSSLTHDSPPEIATPPRFGEHWHTVGFQGEDPATDLRGCGMLGLLQLFMFATTCPGDVRKVFKLSQHAVYEFPMAPVGINVTRVTLKVLRKGLLNDTIRKGNGSVWEVCDRFYKGAWCEFYGRWRSGKCTMAQSGFVNKEWETFLVTKAGVTRAFFLAKQGLAGEDEEEDGREGNGSSKQTDDDEIEFASF
jgi:hypothetical protein